MNIVMEAYSCTRIVSGEPFSRVGGNRVLFMISMTSRFLLSSSPSSSPDARWVQTKQSAVCWSVMLIEIDPCFRKHFSKHIASV